MQAILHRDQLKYNYVYPCPMGLILSGGECVCNSYITDISPTTVCDITITTIIITGQCLGQLYSLERMFCNCIYKLYSSAIIKNVSI